MMKRKSNIMKDTIKDVMEGEYDEDRWEKAEDEEGDGSQSQRRPR